MQQQWPAGRSSSSGGGGSGGGSSGSGSSPMRYERRVLNIKPSATLVGRDAAERATETASRRGARRVKNTRCVAVTNTRDVYDVFSRSVESIDTTTRRFSSNELCRFNKILRDDDEFGPNTRKNRSEPYYYSLRQSPASENRLSTTEQSGIGLT